MWKINKEKPAGGQRVIAIHQSGESVTIGEFYAKTDEVIGDNNYLDIMAWCEVALWCVAPEIGVSDEVRYENTIS